MQMTPEQLEMLKRLKDPIDGYMGPVQIGDMFYNPFRKKICFVDKETIIIEGYYIIPPFCTPDGKRCLLGLLQSLNNDYLTRHLKLECIDGVWIVNTVLTNSWSACDKDPYTAVLKALIIQENV